jgi:hypothetical protein
LGEVVDVPAGCWSTCRQPLGFSEVVVEATTSPAMQTQKPRMDVGEVADSSLGFES